MKKLSYWSLQLVFLAATASLFVGCGCDDNKKSEDDASGTGTAGTSARRDAKADSFDEDDAAADTGSQKPVYTCSGDNATCGLLDTDSCDEGEGCRFLTPATGNADPYAQCVPAGERKAGESCDKKSLCAAGLECNEDSCKKYCCDFGSSDECPANEACIIKIVNKDKEDMGVRLCDRCTDCNPLTAQGCGVGLGCYPIQSTDTDIGCRLCLPSDEEKKPGEACDYPNQCEPGSSCYSVNKAKPVCVSFCDLGTSTDTCAPAGKCTKDLIGRASINNTVGLCIPTAK
jgi:hypothetical protein